MYTKFYGFREKPFNIVPDPSFLYLSPNHQTALTYLEYGLMDMIGLFLLTGEIGIGKTTLIKHFLTQLDSDIEVAVVFNTNVSPEQLLEVILDEFELAVPERGKASCLNVLNQFLLDKYGLGQKVLLVVDEAQNLSQDALEEIRMLSNLHTDKDPLIQILLVGQPGLRTLLQHPSLAQLGQRIAVSYHLAPLSLRETREYIVHRLKVAGAKKKKLFTQEAFERIFQHSAGIPRTINILCNAGLLYGYADDLTSIDGQVIENVVRDKEETGLVAPLPAAEKAQPPSEQFQGNGSLPERLRNLEEQVIHLSAMVEVQIERLERRAESSKDSLVRRLETMLAEERKRTDWLLVQCNLLRDRVNLKKLKLQRNKTQSPAAVAKETKDVSTKSTDSIRIKN